MDEIDRMKLENGYKWKIEILKESIRAHLIREKKLIAQAIDGLEANPPFIALAVERLEDELYNIMTLAEKVK